MTQIQITKPVFAGELNYELKYFGDCAFKFEIYLLFGACNLGFSHLFSSIYQ